MGGIYMKAILLNGQETIVGLDEKHLFVMLRLRRGVIPIFLKHFDLALEIRK
jgi:hypothetical protein